MKAKDIKIFQVDAANGMPGYSVLSIPKDTKLNKTVMRMIFAECMMAILLWASTKELHYQKTKIAQLEDELYELKNKED